MIIIKYTSMKTTKKTTKKAATLEYIVDLTDVETPFDVALQFAIAKHNAGKPLSDSDLSTIVCKQLDLFASDLMTTATLLAELNTCKPAVCCGCEERKPWYKRFWNWLFGKKN